MDLNTHVKSVIKFMTCTIHHQPPLIAIVGERIKIECCCSDFKILCLKKMIELLVQYKDHAPEAAFKVP
jgi:hypothetical protein